MFIGWLTCIPAVLLPHSLCRFTTANAPANRQMPIASVVSSHSKKRKKTDLLVEKSLTNCPHSRLSDDSVTTEFADFPTFAWRTIPRRFSKKRIRLLAFRLWLTTTENYENRLWNWVNLLVFGLKSHSDKTEKQEKNKTNSLWQLENICECSEL